MPLVTRPDGTAIAVPPTSSCPRCSRQWDLDPRKWRTWPRFRPLGCNCPTPENYHSAWWCQCGALIADGCTDVTKWVSTHVPVDVHAEHRFTA